MIRTAVNRTIFSLEALEETNEPLEKLKAGIDSFTEISDELKWGKDMELSWKPFRPIISELWYPDDTNLFYSNRSLAELEDAINNNLKICL